MNILIADSGSTKTDWVLLADGAVAQRFPTSGINPIYQDEDSIVEVLATEYDHWSELVPDKIFYYGAGCIGGDSNATIEGALARLTACKSIVVESDMLGAARAMCGHSRGIVSILGTGANSCLYDGGSIVSSVRPLGFILGDEGSGANIGKRLVADALKGILPAELTERVYQWCGLSYAEIIDHIYRQPYPNRFLARFARFASENIASPAIDKIVVESFTDFARRNLMLYPDCQKTTIHFVGSIAFHFSEQLAHALSTLGLQVGQIVQSPIDGLIVYHSNKD
ncbi:MAG: ATPase [Bacteroidales bacterium]|nr:ATPase [Bacteroidales bacterium]